MRERGVRVKVKELLGWDIPMEMKMVKRIVCKMQLLLQRTSLGMKNCLDFHVVLLRLSDTPEFSRMVTRHFLTILYNFPKVCYQPRFLGANFYLATKVNPLTLSFGAC